MTGAPLPEGTQVWRALDSDLCAQLVGVPLELVLPEHVQQALRAEPVRDRPREVDLVQAGARARAELERLAERGEPGHREAEVRELERLHGHLAFHDHGEARDRVVEVVALAVPLHDVRLLRVVHVPHGQPRVRRDLLRLEPLRVLEAERVRRQPPQCRDVQRRRRDPRPLAQNLAPGAVAKHRVAQPPREVRLRRHLAERRDQVGPPRVRHRRQPAAHSQKQPLETVQRNVLGVALHRPSKGVPRPG